MDIRQFTVEGYTRFYRSLLRFNHDIDSAYALKLTYNLHRAVNITYQQCCFGAWFEEYSEVDFCDKLQQARKRPYRTEIQLFRAMEALFCNIEVNVITAEQSSAFIDLVRMIHRIETQFFHSFGMQIYDELTVYRKCEKGLVPRLDEPGVCLLHEWINITAAKNN